MKSILFSAFISLSILVFTNSINAQDQTSPCEKQEKFQLLDFWVGKWDVYVGDQKIGTNSIEKVVSGCAIIENWVGGRGNEGKSLFYYYPKEERWKQVWVTENPFSNGGVKEKAHVKAFDGGTRFQGTVISEKGTEYLDRTTLNPLKNGHVEQVIEISTDGGESWKQMFRGIYKPTD